MDIQSLKDMVACFCDTILEVNDASELEFNKNKNKFFINCGQILKDKALKNELKLHQDTLFVFLNSYCLKYIESHLTTVISPFYFYEKNKMDCYRSDFLTHLKNYTTAQTVADFFVGLFDLIDNIQKEYIINVVHIGKKIDEKNSFNEEAFNKKLEGYKSELADQKSKYEILKQQIEESQSVLNEVKQKANSIDNEILKAECAQNDRLHSAEKNMLQTSISILGVFAAVVLTFNMGISFGAEALEKFMQSGTYHSTLVILLFGFIIGNVIFALFAFLRYIHNKTPEKNIIPAENTPAENTPAGNTEEKLCKTIIGKIVIGFNGVLILLFIVNLIGWHCNSNKSETTTEPNSTCVCEQCISQTSETTTLDTFVEETT